MATEITPRAIEQIKIAARRLGKSLPGGNLTHTELLNLCSHAFLGVSSYEEAVRASEKVISRRQDGGTPLPKEFGSPTAMKGDWFFYPDSQVVCFEGEFSPYFIRLSRLNSAAEFLDFCLQIQKKKWPKEAVKEHRISATYQVDEFIELMNELCHYYFGSSVQGLYCPSGVPKQVDWSAAIESRKLESRQ